MSNLYRWRVLACMRLLVWESSVSPLSLATRRAGVIGLSVVIPLSLVSVSVGMASGLLAISVAYTAVRKHSFAEELETRLLLYVPNDADSYYRLLASIAVGQCNREMVSRWIQSESRTLQRGIASITRHLR